MKIIMMWRANQNLLQICSNKTWLVLIVFLTFIKLFSLQYDMLQWNEFHCSFQSNITLMFTEYFFNSNHVVLPVQDFCGISVYSSHSANLTEVYPRSFLFHFKFKI